MSLTHSQVDPDLRHVIEALPGPEKLKRVLVRNAQEKRFVRQLLKLHEQAAKIRGSQE